MFVITVEFDIKHAFISEFIKAMQEQATNSLALEEDCLYFDVCQDTEDLNRIFLYEIYTSKAAFDAHLDSDHFKSFSDNVANWVTHKSVKSFTKL